MGNLSSSFTRYDGRDKKRQQEGEMYDNESEED